jgi:hypothetical protein
MLQMEVVREPDGQVHLGELTIIPCFVSGAGNVGNDYQPCLIPEDDEYSISRVMKKLEGTFHLQKLTVSYRQDLNPTTSTEAAKTTEGGGTT